MLKKLFSKSFKGQKRDPKEFTIMGKPARPTNGNCPECGVGEREWCKPGCKVLDPCDRRG